MRRRLGLAAAVLLLGGCAGLGGPRTLTLSEADLARRFAQEFPIERRFLELLDIRLDAPTLTLLPDRNRLAASVSLSAFERLGGSRRSGSAALDTALRWDAATQSLRLSEVRVQSLRLEGLAGAGSGAERLGRLLAEQWLEGLPVYTLREPERGRLVSAGLAPTAVTVTSRGVQISLSPSR